MALDRPAIEELIASNETHYCGDSRAHICLKIVAIADLPTRFGDFQIVAFYNNRDEKDHVALVKGDVCDGKDIPVRMHSECLTGDVFGSLRCDCRDQLLNSMEQVAGMEKGIILYLRQEGRGIGLLNKMKAYQLQDFGYDTVEANVALGFRDDERDYELAAHMLMSLKVESIQLMTNNPRKIEDLKRHGIDVSGRIPLIIPPNVHNERYLKTKMNKFGHMLNLDRSEEKKEEGDG
jgi:GTP cyclohydrolase II